MWDMTVKDIAQELEDLVKHEKLYALADEKARPRQQTVDTALMTNRQYQDNLMDCITWQQGPHSLQEALTMAIIAAYRLEGIQQSGNLSNGEWTEKDLSGAVRLIDGIIATLERETGTTREELGLENFRPRHKDTTTLFKRAESKAKTILKKSERASRKRDQEKEKIKTDCFA